MLSPFRTMQVLESCRSDLGRGFDICTFVLIQTPISCRQALLIILYNSRFNEKTVNSFNPPGLKRHTGKLFPFYLSHDKPCGKLALGQNCIDIISDKSNSVAVFANTYRY